jgi:hypothetical protein
MTQRAGYPVYLVGCLLLASQLVGAQNPPAAAQNPPAVTQSPSDPPTFIADIRFARGRNVVPYLEGWIRNPDETFDFVFGYYNRNVEEDLAIPAGPDNSVMPGGPDRGQPTWFVAGRQAGRQQRVFRVRVPKDWGDKTLTWSLTAHGHTDSVIAKLVPAEEITEHMMIAKGSNTTVMGETDTNQPPTIAVTPVTSATVGAPLTLTSLVTDDGLPKPPKPVPQRPVSTGADGRFQAQRNTSGQGRVFAGLRVIWLEYRGPAKVAFETNPISVKDGKAVTTARFAAPGTYTLIATADDSRLTARTQLTINVAPANTTQQP